MNSPKDHKTLYDPQTGTKLLTLKEAAKYLDYHPYSVYRLVSQGDLKPQRIGGKTLVFLQKELDRYRAGNEWAARKKSMATDPEAARIATPVKMTATVMADMGLGLTWGQAEVLKDFTWEQIPLIRAKLTEKYGDKMKAFEITVKNPDGWTWRIGIEPPPLIEKLMKSFSRKKASK
jgi:excisionase family DNA binding protein